MFKIVLLFMLYAGCLALATLAGVKASFRFLILFPTVLLPGYFLVQGKALKFIILCGSGLLAALLIIASHVHLVHFAVYLSGIALFSMLMTGYRKNWFLKLKEEVRFTSKTQRELNQLNEKYQSRMDSLHHLEKQVSGLLDLFEVAKGFSECLNFEKMGEILSKKVRTEMPFDQAKMILFDRSDPVVVSKESFWINENSLILENVPISPGELHDIDVAKLEKRLVETDSKWTFPLVSDDRVAACFIVQGANYNDLAKFEVLSALLALQVKKVNLYLTVCELSIRDSLTGLFIRRHFLERFDEELKRSRKFDLPLSVLMLDIDHFKRYNDEYGHLAGDTTLKQVASLLKLNLRKVDILARFGGEEFIIVIPESQRQAALEVAERIRSGVARHDFKIYSNESKVTVSIGVAGYPEDAIDAQKQHNDADLAEHLIQCADKALYQAKEEGRNRVVSFHNL